MALLPVRLETRFSGGELPIRVYPDTIHLDTHEPELTPAEVKSGQWEHMWRAGTDAGREQAAWRELTAHHGPERAAWIYARLLRPRNVTWPTEPLDESAPVNPPLVMPDPAPGPAGWTRAARALPTRWRAKAALWAGVDPRDDPPSSPPTNIAARRQADSARPAVGSGSLGDRTGSSLDDRLCRRPSASGWDCVFR